MPKVYLGPPKNIPPERLFRLLIARPRPSLALTYRFPPAPDVPLRVVAQRGTEELLDWDAASALNTDGERARHVMGAVLARCLYSGSSPAFGSVDEVGMLQGEQLEELCAEVVAALRVISPCYGRSDEVAWSLAIDKGAGHMSNYAEAYLVGQCYGDHGEQPERYFGGNLGDLTDGQLMTYRVCVKRVIEERKRG